MFPCVQTMRPAQRGEKSCEQNNDASSGSNNNKNSNNKYNQSGRNISSNNVCRAQLCFSSLKAPGARLETAMAMYDSVVKNNKDILWDHGYQADPRDPRTKGEGPCGRSHTPEKSYRSNQWCVWLNCEVCALRLHYAPVVGASSKYVSLGPVPAHVKEMLVRLQSVDKLKINGNLVRGLLKSIQGEAQSGISHNGGKKSSGNTACASSSGPSNKGGCGDDAALDRWEIVVRRLLKH